MLLFIDNKGLNNEAATFLGETEKVVFVHNFKNCNITNDWVKYVPITNLEYLKTLDPEIIIIVDDFTIINTMRSIYPNASVVVILGQGVPTQIPSNLQFTLVAPPNTGIRDRVYAQTSLLMDVKEIGNVKDWKPFIAELRQSKRDITAIPAVKNRVLMIKRTRLAFAPDELAQAINKYTKYHADVDCVPRPDYQILHYHNVYIPAKHNRKVIQYHSEPQRVTFSHFFKPEKEFPKRELVISQYHATLPEYKHCQIVQNVINFDNPQYELKFVKKIRIGYSPSTVTRINEYFDKGFQQTLAILKSIPNIEFDIITGVPLEECIRRKSECSIIIDECVTGSFHRSGLEGLALGKMTICWLKPDVVQVLKDVTGDERCPFENIHIDNLKEFLTETCAKMSIQEINDRGVENRRWMKRNWHPKIIAKKFEKMYDEMISKN